MLIQQIDEDLKTALKEKNDITISALRNLKAEIKNTEIDKRKSLSEEEVLEAVRKKVKQHKDSIESFQTGNRADLVEHEQGQMTALVKYLPAQMSEDEVRKLVIDAIKESSATQKDFGKVMKEVMARAKGAVDGKIVSEIVKQELK